MIGFCLLVLFWLVGFVMFGCEGKVGLFWLEREGWFGSFGLEGKVCWFVGSVVCLVGLFVCLLAWLVCWLVGWFGWLVCLEGKVCFVWLVGLLVRCLFACLARSIVHEATLGIWLLLCQ
jgi:hypothetical protein